MSIVLPAITPCTNLHAYRPSRSEPTRQQKFWVLSHRLLLSTRTFRPTLFFFLRNDLMNQRKMGHDKILGMNEQLDEIKSNSKKANVPGSKQPESK